MRIIVIISLLVSLPLQAGKINKKLPNEHRQIYGLILEKSTLQDVLSKFGKTEDWERKDEKHGTYFYCYKLNSKKDTWVIFGFGWQWDYKRLNSITVTRKKSDLKGSCANTKISAKALRTAGRLSLGLSEEKIRKIIKDQPKKNGNNYIYSYEMYEKFKKPRKYKTSELMHIGTWHYGELEIELINNKIIKYSIWASGEPESKLKK